MRALLNALVDPNRMDFEIVIHSARMLRSELARDLAR
jgi:hypothetical protein